MAFPPRPLIAITTSLELGERPKLSLGTRYADAVLRAGGIPLAIPPIGGPTDVERLVERVDGVLFSGGDDFDTARLGLGPTHPKATPVPSAKQDFDFELARAVLARGTPVLGICYGMQLLALAEGGRLYQHLPEDRPNARQHSGNVEHPVAVESGSKLAHATRESSLAVVSRHHQAVASVRAPWNVNARDDEGLIEGIERADHPFALGVQWHPELSPEGSPNDRILRAFVDAAALHAARLVKR
ncbi:MAG: gamma-glutamyl-gamma-aminobutyrate hydrolase family protein [Planctomycetes bacterium]|nr:gamma-glutamyl-gamma-aminobutyrate hydrolase family protein [Planctomycetota bacterium]